MQPHISARVMILVVSLLTVFFATGVFADSVEFKIDTEMDESFIGSFKMVNTGEKTMEDPAFEFDFPYKITSVWDAVLVSDRANHYVIKLPGWVSTLPPNEVFRFGFNGSPRYSGAKPTNLKFNGVPVKLTGN